MRHHFADGYGIMRLSHLTNEGETQGMRVESEVLYGKGCEICPAFAVFSQVFYLIRYDYLPVVWCDTPVNYNGASITFFIYIIDPLATFIDLKCVFIPPFSLFVVVLRSFDATKPL